MNLEVNGHIVFKGQTQQITEKYKKREFVIEIAEEINGNTYTNYAKFQLSQSKCDVLDRFNEGDHVKVNFNIKGNRWERDGKVNYITNLEAWRIENIGPSQHSTANNDVSAYCGAPSSNNTSNGSYRGATNFNVSPETIDDLPF